MSYLEIIILAIGLGMDCLAVSIASGIKLRNETHRPTLLISSSFGLFQAFMPLIGWCTALTFCHLIENIDHWIAFLILGFLGFRMIRESLHSDSCHATFDPTRKRVIFALAVATSIDALVIGITFACLGITSLTEIFIYIFIIGITSFIMSIGGLKIGMQFGCKLAKRINPELWGGMILIGIGSKILIEHLFFN